MLKRADVPAVILLGHDGGPLFCIITAVTKAESTKTLNCFTNQQIYNAFSMYCADVALPVCLGLNNRRRLKGFCFHFCCIRLEDNALGLHVEYTVIPAKVASQ